MEKVPLMEEVHNKAAFFFEKLPKPPSQLNYRRADPHLKEEEKQTKSNINFQTFADSFIYVFTVTTMKKCQSCQDTGTFMLLTWILNMEYITYLFNLL